MIIGAAPPPLAGYAEASYKPVKVVGVHTDGAVAVSGASLNRSAGDHRLGRDPYPRHCACP